MAPVAVTDGVVHPAAERAPELDGEVAEETWGGRLAGNRIGWALRSAGRRDFVAGIVFGRHFRTILLATAEH
jgi:hypothetical protein